MINRMNTAIENMIVMVREHCSRHGINIPTLNDEEEGQGQSYDVSGVSMALGGDKDETVG